MEKLGRRGKGEETCLEKAYQCGKDENVYFPYSAHRGSEVGTRETLGRRGRPTVHLEGGKDGT